MRLIPAGTARCRLATRLAQSPAAVADWVAAELASLIRARAVEGRPCVLILPTGSTPLGVYARLIAEHRAKRLSFAHVHTFNLDEYHGLAPDHLRSYHRFMWENLFSQVDIPRHQAHVPDGMLAPEAVPAHARAYEEDIARLGGVDLCLLGIGRNGHIAFNEPGSPRGSRTRLAALDRVTRRDAARDFVGEANVPRRGVTMGVASIMAARRIILMACGEAKAAPLLAAIEGPASEAIPASLLQEHAAVELVLDPGAAGSLSAVNLPWLADAVVWDEAMTKRAVLGLALAAKKPLLKLVESDYSEHGLLDVVAARGPAHDINLTAFRGLQAVITGWPGGKPPSRKRPGDIDRPRDAIFPKRILVCSPHPDDDVISMGGTLCRLADHGHEVHVAYQVSGNTAVSESDVDRHLAFAIGAAALLGQPSAFTVSDPVQRRALRALVRRTEAIAAAGECGVPAERLHFLDLPFYDRRGSGGDPIAADDVARMVEVLEQVKPHQLYAAGDLGDPHGTHRRCLEVLIRALAVVSTRDWFATCERWLYRGAWEEWEPHRIDMAVPLTPDDVGRKRRAIVRHQSQKDGALFMGEDAREFWQRSEDRTRATAKLFDRLGLAEYEAIEAFHRWDGVLLP